jgi:hypothetical protein
MGGASELCSSNTPIRTRQVTRNLRLLYGFRFEGFRQSVGLPFQFSEDCGCAHLAQRRHLQSLLLLLLLVVALPLLAFALPDSGSAAHIFPAAIAAS